MTRCVCWGVLLRQREIHRVRDWPAACWDWCVTESRVLRGRYAGGCRCASWSWGRWCNGCRNLYRAHWPSLTLIGGFATPEWPSPSEGRRDRTWTDRLHNKEQTWITSLFVEKLLAPFSWTVVKGCSMGKRANQNVRSGIWPWRKSALFECPCSFLLLKHQSFIFLHSLQDF